MACTTVAKLTRFIVNISEDCSDLATANTVLPSGGKIFSNCIKVTGLSLGEEGAVAVPQWGVTGQIADGQRTLATLALDFRIEDSLPSTAGTSTSTNQLDLLANMYSNRASIKYKIEVAITDRAFKALFIYKFKNCDMRFFKNDDQELGAGKLGMIMTEFLPLDAELWSCSAAATGARISSPAASGLTWAAGSILC